MNKEGFLKAWEQYLSVYYEEILSGKLSPSWEKVKSFYDKNHEDVVEKRFWAAYDAEGNYPGPEDFKNYPEFPDNSKEYVIETKEFGPITVDAETYHKYYDKLMSL